MSKSEFPYLPNETPVDCKPTWLAKFFSAGPIYKFQIGLVFFCVDCERGPYQEKHFQEGEEHYRHRRLKMHYNKLDYADPGAISVYREDVEVLGVNTELVQDFTVRSSSSRMDGPFIYTHQSFRYAMKFIANKTNWVFCSECNSNLRRVDSVGRDGTLLLSKFCCLKCKFDSVRDLTKGFSTPPKSPVILGQDTYKPKVVKVEANSSGKTGDGKRKETSITRRYSNDSTGSRHASVEEHSIGIASDSDQMRRHSAKRIRHLETYDTNTQESTGNLHASAAEHSNCIVSHSNLMRTDWPKSMLHLDTDDTNTKEKLKQRHLDEDWGSKRLFQKALAAASRTDNWRPHKTTTVTKSDWGVNGNWKEVEAERPGLMSKLGAEFVNGGRQAKSLLHGIGSEVLNNPGVWFDDDKSSADKPIKGLELSVASPGKESFKVEGFKKFISLKELLLTFDPQSWVSDDLRPQVLPELSPAQASVR